MKFFNPLRGYRLYGKCFFSPQQVCLHHERVRPFSPNEHLDAEACRFIVHFIQSQASVLTDWWNAIQRQSKLASEFPYHLEATLYIFRIYSKVVSLCCSMILLD